MLQQTDLGSMQPGSLGQLLLSQPGMAALLEQVEGEALSNPLPLA
jgi:hypothetical protein